MAERLCKVTKDALMLGIEKAKPGNTLRQIGTAIQTYVENLITTGYITLSIN
jgi:methionyl aminopeptidase